jgi:NADP-dependent 3-hydroxy acid dehydrogenase YdfG
MHFTSDHVVVVTGASSGVGRAIALAFAEAGVSLALVGRNPSTLESVADCAVSGAGEIRCYVADLTKDEDLFRFPRQIMDDFGRVDLVIHSAALLVRSRLQESQLASFDLQFACNVRAPYVINQLFLPSLLAKRGGMVFINSSAGLEAKPCMGQYAATKHALKALADCQRLELVGTGVRVLSVFLGRTATPMQAALCASEGKTYEPSLFVQPGDVAVAVLAALSLPASAEITDLTLRPMS